ncbi:LCP family protein [Solirubrobacter sp. CPCC 204708]|uniref:LCP family protein n=1 Tax=Solirubrobacter deserti TaxID=2282478 RepID=A0ABT4RP25_9ACTN|nr:LCP family protein [Solirubrobacter deserti]MBE2319261.1 LCP family protein [Solirubrobacter deserti]MDA0140267.1 LCP family protein [Solirubrobacter deserti]
MRDPDRPPRPGRGVLVRALLAAVLTVFVSATAAAYAVLNEVDSLVDEFGGGGKEGRTFVNVPEVTDAEAGDPRTFLILGTDERYADKVAGVKPRSDTILLARVDPKSDRIALMSLPRDLKVRIPGSGTNKINVAYEVGGPRKTVATVKRLFEDATGEEFPINHVIAVSFGGFRRAVNYIGGVYVDIDRRYYNDNSTAAAGEAYATIDVQPGYQMLKGQDALDYVRYRHGDNDFFRASRQQDFLRQITHQDAVRQLLDPSKRHELARIFGRYFEVDKSFTRSSNLIALAQLGLNMAQAKAPVNEVRFPATEAENPAVDSYLYVKDSDLKKTYDEFMTGEGSSNPRRLDETTKPEATATPARTKKKNRPSAVKGLEEARTEGENMAVLVASENKLGFPFYFPERRKTGSRYADPEPRIYSLRDGQGKLHRAYRLTLNAGSWSEYYGIQGMTWQHPPILDDPDRVREVNGRKLELFYDGSRIRLVAWRTSKGVYWVTNTLTLSIPNSRLIAIASSLRRLK